MASKEKPRRLTHGQSYTVMTFLSTQRDTFTREPTTYSEIAGQVQEKTGVECSVSSIKGMLQELGIRPKFKGIGGGPSKSEQLQTQINTLLEMLRDTDAKLKAMADDMKAGFVKQHDGSYMLLQFKGANR